jgi:hypothetical protein
MAPSRNILMLAFPRAQRLDIGGFLQIFTGANDALGYRRTHSKSRPRPLALIEADHGRAVALTVDRRHVVLVRVLAAKARFLRACGPARGTSASNSASATTAVWSHCAAWTAPSRAPLAPLPASFVHVSN